MLSPQKPQKDLSWTKVERKRKKKKKVEENNVKGNALIIQIEQPKYSDVLRTMQSDAKLVDLGANVRSIRRTRTSEMILELKRDKERKGVVYKSLVKGVDARSLTAEVTLKIKNLDEVAEAQELVTELRQQCEVQVANATVRLRKGSAATRGGRK